MKEISRGPLLGMKLMPVGGGEALCFVCTVDHPFLLSRVAGNFTIHDCDILEAEIAIREGVVTDLYRIRLPKDCDPSSLERRLLESLLKILRGDTNIEKEIFLWEKGHGVIRDEVIPRFEGVTGDTAVLSVRTSNKKGLLHKISWTLSLAGMNIERAVISATEDSRARDVFWIRQRHKEPITAEYQEKILGLLRIIVNEGKDPIEQAFRKEINMIYRQQLRRRGSGLRTAKLYADVHLRLIQGLFDRLKEELDIAKAPLVIGVYGGIGSGAIGFTSDVDCIFLYHGTWREEYDKLKRLFKNEFKRICDLDIDESFLPHHINYFHLGQYDGERIISFDDFLDYVCRVGEMRSSRDSRFFQPQFFHFPWAFSMRFLGGTEALDLLKSCTRRRLIDGANRSHESIRGYILGEKGEEIKGDYISYLKGHYFPKELGFLDGKGMRLLYRQRAYQEFIESIQPYDCIKYVFRRGVLPLLHIIHRDSRRTDVGLLRHEHPEILPAINFMLKAYNVRKTLFIVGKWDLNYFLHIMDCRTEREFCERYLGHQEEVADFVARLIA
ncbi:MAG: hypothetical protein ACUVXD_02185 [Thermodesulfobacteriota bacterium]